MAGKTMNSVEVASCFEARRNELIPSVHAGVQPNLRGVGGGPGASSSVLLPPRQEETQDVVAG
eukprot:10613725-Heterocapsa_arctica.AAC.1